MERVCTFGTEAAMVGLLALPDGGAAPREPAVVLLNAGLLHRVGPQRLYVALARRLAAQGFPTLRFDFTGIGDSEPRRDRHSAEQRVVLDVREAMELLSREAGSRRFVVMGLCSGAVDAHKCAVRDEGVVGAVCLDGYAYPTLRFCARRWVRRLTHPIKLVSFVRRLAAERRDRQQGTNRVADPRTEMFDWDLPPKAQVEADLRKLVDRGVNLLCVFTGGNRQCYSYEGQFRDGFRDLDFRGRLEETLFADADHVFSLIQSRELLIERISAWMDARYPR
jgi:pimeloyl-ACP methyl ester carboxylesterase